MKKFLIFLFSAFLLVSCSSPDKDKATVLAELKAEYEALGAEIQILETEIGSDGITANEKVKAVVAEPVGKSTFIHYLEVQATVDTDENINVSAQAGGLVQRIVVKEGDRVSKGQLLAELDNKAMLQGLEELKTNFNLVKALFEKQKNLWDQKIGSEIQFLTAKANMEGMEKRLASMKEQIEMTKIKSPINGTVDAVMIKEGQAIAPGMPAIRVVNLSNLKVKAEIPESYAGKLKNGDKAEVYFPDRKLTLDAKVSFVGKVISRLNRTFDLEVSFNPGTIQLNPNMVAALRIVDMQVDSALVVPINVVQSSEAGKFVYVAESTSKGYIAKKKIVHVGSTYRENALITEGLIPTDYVIRVGYESLTNDQPVKF